MSYRLYLEVMEHAPTMTPQERLVLLVIAERVRDLTTRECTLDMHTLSRRCGGLDPSNIRAALRRLADRGVEVRVPVGADRAGRPVYTYRGQVPRYRLPVFPPPAGCRCDLCLREATHQPATTPPAVEDEGGRSRPPSPRRAAQEPPTSRWQRPGGPSPAEARIRLVTGASEDEARQVLDLIHTQHRPRSLPAYVRSLPPEDLTRFLTQVRATAPPQLGEPCGECGPNRWRELPDGTPYRCPTCHPLAAKEAVSW